MSEVVDRWVEKLKGKLEPIGQMTHWQRMEAAFRLEQPDLVPAAPELDYWQITYANYGHDEIYNDVDKTTDACIKTWADLRPDAIWMYVDIGHELDSLLPPESRDEYFKVRGPKDYVLFRPVAETLDEAIALFEGRVWEKYIETSRAVTHYTPHMLQLLEFQEKMERIVPVIVGSASPTNHAETIVGVERFVKWLITEDANKLKHYLNLVLQERLEALNFYRDFAYNNGCRFFCIWGGARTWGPRHLEEFGEVDRIFVEAVGKIFPYAFWHHCGKNLPYALQQEATWTGIRAVQYDEPYYFMDVSWRDWCEQVAKWWSGKLCAMNAPTTQMACYGTPQQVERMVKDFIEATLPHTTAIVMPGCEIDSYAPTENVVAMIQTARKTG